MILVKVGGSVITNKGRECMPRPDNIRRVMRELGTIKENLMLVHGAGSFGHFKAKKYAQVLKNGVSPEVRPIIFEIHRDLLRLSMMLLDAMDEAGMQGVLLPGHAIASCTDGEISLNGRIIEGFLRLGMTPVSNGDIVLMRMHRFAICSGDMLMTSLARCLSPRMALFITDVDGIFRDGTLAESISPGERIDELPEADSDMDVTGEMNGKWEAAQMLCRMGVHTVFVNGTVPGRVEALLRGEDVPGTVVRRP